jgi:tRNA pseudouridine38-40 synthase
MPEYKYKLLLSYEGTQYGGWQVQPNAVSIQQLVGRALQVALRLPDLTLTGAGRTDAGVHALGQVAHFTTPTPIDEKRLLFSLNGILPPDIRVREVTPVPDAFHARYSAIGKIYHYHLHTTTPNPFKRHYSTFIYYSLDLTLLKQAASRFVGTHDFSAFANESSEGSAGKNPIRTITRLDVIEEPGGIRLEFEGNGFLYKMVRNITGTLLEICEGRIKLEDLDAIFASKDRKRAGKAAPAHGLFLVEVHYPKGTVRIEPFPRSHKNG